ncbi:hypothetical protein GLOIN_2v1504510 [Rhizophagus clarus]|uniref:NAD(P)-binding domain-containing protein n=1 Tax=Rhizophagus clarus TaxID=94130 RepID=A0A8H3QQA6_9GLOM|nr:hypothetical protein GLOIN_2v1504510 [Rhizophagus clarus]
MSNIPYQFYLNTPGYGRGTVALGYAIAEAFLNDGSYNVKILRRKPENENEKVKLLASKGAEIVYADYDQHNDLVKALKGTNVVVSALKTDLKIPGFYDLKLHYWSLPKMPPPRTYFLIEDKIKLGQEVEKSGLEYTYCVSMSDYFKNILVETLKLPEARNAHINVAGAFLTLNEYLELFEKATVLPVTEVIEELVKQSS